MWVEEHGILVVLVFISWYVNIFIPDLLVGEHLAFLVY